MSLANKQDTFFTRLNNVKDELNALTSEVSQHCGGSGTESAAGPETDTVSWGGALSESTQAEAECHNDIQTLTEVRGQTTHAKDF